MPLAPAWRQPLARAKKPTSAGADGVPTPARRTGDRLVTEEPP
ncbi:hypothetical protein [Jatrophihabitans fulvus]